MRKRCLFRPALPDRLEERVALSVAAQVSPVTVRPVTQRKAQPSLESQVTVQVNQAFDSFTQDYLRAQATFVSTLSTTPAGTTNPAQSAFTGYIRQRVRLLDEQLVAAFSQVPGGLNYVPSGAFGNGSYVVQSFIRRQIDGPARTRGVGASGGPLVVALQNNVPTSGDPQAVALYTLNATTAINTARRATLNSTGFLIHHTFHNGHPRH